MRRIGMNRLSVTLTAVPALAASLLLAGCASSSRSTAAGTAAPSASATWTGTSEHAGSPAPLSSGAATASAAAPTTSAGAGSPRVPAAATSAEVTYLGPTMAKPVRVAKHVAGMPYEKLATALDALKPVPAGIAECMVLTGENATVTITSDSHTWVFTVDGSPCRPVIATKDGVRVARLTNSPALLRQIRAIAGFTGMAHPLTG